MCPKYFKMHYICRQGITFVNKLEPLKSVLEPLCLVMHLEKCIMGNTDTYAQLSPRMCPYSP